MALALEIIVGPLVLLVGTVLLAIGSDMAATDLVVGALALALLYVGAVALLESRRPRNRTARDMKDELDAMKRLAEEP